MFQTQRQPSQNLGSYQQTTTGRGIAHQLFSLGSYGQHEVPPRMHHGSNPVPYEEYIQQWDALVGGDGAWAQGWPAAGWDGAGVSPQDETKAW